jgi:hypothetical protein
MHQRQAERRQRRRDLRCRENGHLGTLSFSRQVLGWRSELSITERSLLRVMPIILFWVRGSRQGTWDYDFTEKVKGLMSCESIARKD